jgi:hypothetical protein
MAVINGHIMQRKTIRHPILPLLAITASLLGSPFYPASAGSAGAFDDDTITTEGARALRADSPKRASDSASSVKLCKKLAGFEDKDDPAASDEKTVETDDLIKNTSAALATCTRARSETPSDSRLIFLVARIQFLGPRTEENISQFRDAATKGSLTAMMFLSEILTTSGSQYKDLSEAKKWIRKRSEAIIGARGEVVSSDAREALDFLDVNVGCAPETRRFREPSPFEHIKHTKSVSTTFLGTARQFQIAVDVTDRALNTSRSDWNEQVKNQIDFSKYYVAKADWRDIDAHVEANESNVKLVCRTPDCVHAEYINKLEQKWLRGSISSLDIEVCNNAVATRIANAMRLLILENGGKESKF